MTNNSMLAPDPKAELVSWSSRQDSVSLDSIGKWHTGQVYNQLPTKSRLRKEGLANIAKGWLPVAPIIDTDTRVLAVGSCFARNFTLWLAEHGFNQSFTDSPYNALLRFNADFESPAAIAQQFRWAFDEVDQSTLLWIDKNRHLIAATDDGKRLVRETLERAEVLILTLGLSEVWYDKLSGEPLWRALTEQTYDPERHVFRIEPVAKTIEWLECIERLRQKHLPHLKVIYTLSPIPLKTTFRPISAITANAVSKAVLRAALDEFLRNHQDKVNESLYYFPSYEIVLNYFIDPFRADNRHLAPIVPGSIIAFFAKHFCTPNVGERRSGSLAELPGGEMQEKVMRHAAAGEDGTQSRELLSRIAELEDENDFLQSQCDERLKVIVELDKAATERLELINRLDEELKKATKR